MAEINYYHCSRCGEITRQIEISTQEMEAAMGHGAIMQLCGFINDINGLGWLMKKTGFIRPMKCSKCGRISRRSTSGDDKGYIAG